MKYWDVRLPPNGSLSQCWAADAHTCDQPKANFSCTIQVSGTVHGNLLLLGSSWPLQHKFLVGYDVLFFGCAKGFQVVPGRFQRDLPTSRVPMGSCKVPRLQSSKTTKLQACELTKFYGPHGFQSSKVSEHHRILKFLLRFKAPGLKKLLKNVLQRNFLATRKCQQPTFALPNSITEPLTT